MKDKTKKQKKDNREILPNDSQRVSKSPYLSFDYSEFAHFLSDTDLSDEQKKEYLSVIWSIVCEFVMLGASIHPAQQAQYSYGDESGPHEPDSKIRPDELYLTPHLLNELLLVSSEETAPTIDERV